MFILIISQTFTYVYIFCLEYHIVRIVCFTKEDKEFAKEN